MFDLFGDTQLSFPTCGSFSAAQKRNPIQKDSLVIKEALQFLSERVATHHSAKVLSVPGDGRKVYIDQGGQLTTIDVAPALRKHTVQSVADLIEAAKRWNAKPTIWVSDNAIVLVTDDEDRRDVVTMPLTKSAGFLRLEALEKNPTLDQLGMLRTLRIDLKGTAGRADLLTVIRSLKWRQSASGHVDVQQGKESLGKVIENEVTGAGAIPEEVMVSVPVYSNPGESKKSYPVACDLEVIASEQVFRFRPVADELRNTLTLAQGEIVGYLGTALPDVAVFFGTP